MNWFFSHLATPLLAAAMLLGMFGTTSMHLSPADAGDYHERVRNAVDNVPYILGDWLGRDVPQPAEATELLRPNAMLSRLYVNTDTGHRVHVMLVHCLDARDLQGHYPPVCYPGIGWRTTGRETRELPTGQHTLPVAYYAFDRATTHGSQQLEVLNLMVLPDGGFGVDMRPVDRIAGSHTFRHLGAAQIQILPDADMSPEQKTEAWHHFADTLAPAIAVIQSGTATD